MKVFRDIEGVKTILHQLDVNSQPALKKPLTRECEYLLIFRIPSECTVLDFQIGDYIELEEFKGCVYMILDEPNNLSYTFFKICTPQIPVVKYGP